MGCPIRISLALGLFTTPQGFSQFTTSFIAATRQGIHRMLFSTLTPQFSTFVCACPSHAELRLLHAMGTSMYVVHTFCVYPNAVKELNYSVYRLMETSGIEPLTPCLQGRCSPS